MRRGHANIGGWRNENSRHFMPRNGGPPQFRPNRNYHLQDSTRFPPPIHHSFREPPFNNRPGLLKTPSPDHDRNKYRKDNRHNNQYRMPYQNPRSTFYLHDHNNMSYEGKDHDNKSHMYNVNKRHYDNSRDEEFDASSISDIHHQPTGNYTRHVPYGRHFSSQWDNSSDSKSHFYDDRNIHKTSRCDNIDGIKVPAAEYSGHRPPSSDHYGGNPSSTLDNSNSFSRSVDDTVDFIRKRLQNRECNQPVQEHQTEGHEIESHITEPSDNYQNVQQNQPVKRRPRRRSVNVEANCDKMKNKIVHQLFKMDKDKIHKLMDNPSSSSKFEYALSSLITESQNSLNRHLRSVAEKSLCSSEAFVHNDSNTIYEDTFMKQMQGILDPQDTVLLEDIKPLVLAELSKVLQLDEYDQPFQAMEDPDNSQAIADQQFFSEYDYDHYPSNDYYEQMQSPQNAYEEIIPEVGDSKYTPVSEDRQLLFERRPAQVNVDRNTERRLSSESRRHSRTSTETTAFIDNSVNSDRGYSNKSFNSQPSAEAEQPQPLFDTKAEELSEDEDPFAELDKQYHVAVDPNFIDTYDISSPQQSVTDTNDFNTQENCNNINSAAYGNKYIEQAIDSTPINVGNQLKSNSPIKLVDTANKNKIDKNMLTIDSCAQKIKNEIQNTTGAHEVIFEKNSESIVESLNLKDLISKSEGVSSKTPLLSNSRKRSIDQKPSHRKEKRKKNDNSPTEPLRDTNTNVNAAKIDANNSNFNKEMSKDTKIVETVDKSYSDKYVKRKETVKKNAKDDNHKNKQRLSSTSSTVSPKENTSNKKNDSKSKLQTIDMFLEHPKKVNLHQAHRNTAVIPTTTSKTIGPKKHVSTQVNRKLHTKETQTLESKIVSTRFCQTEKKKTGNKSVQTDAAIATNNICNNKASRAKDPFERMKEIDMEIQALLQEKFKLYNSLEANEPCPSRIQTLGMTVLNVASPDPKENENIDTFTEDSMVEEFTNIPVEELEQIALGTADDYNEITLQSDRKSRRQKIRAEERTSSSSPTTRNNAKKPKAPNISLIEKIVTEDIPLEELISLDDLEKTPIKNTRQKPKKKMTKKSRALKSTFNVTDFQLKPCSVVLTREDFSKYLEPIIEESPIESNIQEVVEEEVLTEAPVIIEDNPNDLHFDMLDVSEDIVIGDNCEVKSADDKDVERTVVAINDEVILDNSQPLEPHQSDRDQGENKCKMYDYSTDESLLRDSITVTGHADAVLALESVENNFIAACLDGNVYYFDSDGHLLTTLRGSNLAVTCLTIVKEKYGTTVYTGSLDSRIRYYNLETGLEKGPECNVLSPIQTMDRAWDTIFVGTRTGFVLQFECKNNMLIPVSTVKFSEQSILALRAMKEGPRKVLLVAARSEDVTVKDAQTGLLLRTLQGPKMTVYTLLYEDGKIYCGTSSHHIHVFDYASGSHAGVHEGGKGAVCLRASGGLLLAGCYDGCVYVYREGEPRPLAQLRGPSLMLLSLAIVGSKIIAGYKDRSLYIWKIPLSILQEMIL